MSLLQQLPPLTAATANPDAATAAAAAAALFRRHEPTPSLSAAAAAAALRARPTTPTRVADVQTKRTQRRSASVASTGTASDQGRGQSGLRRRGSSGSMTERTFRTPSPHRPATSGSGHQRSQSGNEEMPPVPALPRHMDTAARQPGAGTLQQQELRHRKTASLVVGHTGPAGVRLASQKLASADAPSWFGAAIVGDLGSVRRTDPAMASPPSSPLQVVLREESPLEGQRPGSQASSINFSYPTRARRGSATALSPIDQGDAVQLPVQTRPTRRSTLDEQAAQAAQASQTKHQPGGGQARPHPTRRQSAPNSPEQALVYDPHSRRMVRQADLLPTPYVQQAVPATPQQPLGSPKKKPRARQKAGSHLAAGTMSRAKPVVPLASLLPQAQPSSPLAQTLAERPVKPAAPREVVLTQEIRADVEEPAVKAIINSPRIEAKRLEQQRGQIPVDLSLITAPTAAPFTQVVPAPAHATVRRQPSVVHEEQEPEDIEIEQTAPLVMADILDAVPRQPMMQTTASPEVYSPASPPPTINLPSSAVLGDPVKGPVEQRSETGPIDVSGNGEPEAGATEHGQATRVSSNRTQSLSPARQAHFGPIHNSLTVKHSPPPRSTSPRKSAMKHASPPRASSPAGDTSEASGSVVHEPLTTRKKSVRVSFDDAGTGMASEHASIKRTDSPLAVNPPPANRHSWLANLGRFQDLPSLDDNCAMTPRPALPSFGSLRDKKPRETVIHQSERPLVRPKGETRYDSPLLPSPPLGLSSDHALGAVLSNAHGRGSDEAQHSSAHREPLPPVVTSVEGSGYFSDVSDDSSILSSEFAPSEVSLPGTTSEPVPEVPAIPAVNGSRVSRPEPLPLQTTGEQYPAPEQQIPEIAVSQPTPVVAEDKMLVQEFIPGGFPEDESEPSAKSTPEQSQTPEVNPQNSQSEQPAAEITQPATADTSSDSDEDVFSDACEDLSEVEGDGFQSLAAVVDSPLQQSPRAATRAEPEHTVKEAPAERSEAPKLQTEISSATTAVGTPPVEKENSMDEWEKAKAYWRSLTAEKRAQLEREALEEAGTEADRDDVVEPATRQKKKSLERRNSERKALAAHMAQQSRAQQEGESAAHNSRTYMIQPGEKWAGDEDLKIPPMRKTMRETQAVSASAERPRLRKSMRAGGDRPSKPPVSMVPVGVPVPGTSHQRSASQVEPISATASYAHPPLRRRGSTGSESSFRRSRAAKGQGFGFRQSLRPTSPPSTLGDNQSSKRFSLRTLSPTGSATKHDAESPPANSSPTTQMRTTLRDTERKSSSGIRLPSFGLSYGGSKKHGSKGPGNRVSGSRASSSRFADSSDEDGGGGGISSGFRSRFEDSSDDEPVMPIPLPKSAYPPTPNSGIIPNTNNNNQHLRKESSVASTALPEELEESDQPATTAAPAVRTTSSTSSALRRTRSGKGQLLPATQAAATAATITTQSATAPTTSGADNTNRADGHAAKRHSFMSVLRHRKKNNAAAKVGRAEVVDSPARRDTRLERSAGQLERIRSRGEEGEEHEGRGEEAEEGEDQPTPMPVSPLKGSRLQKRRVAESGGGVEAGVVGHNSEGQDGGGSGVGGFNASAPKRSNTSGNLGTRTLSSGGGGFFHLSPHRRVASMGVAAAEPVPSVDGSVAGSVAGASSTTRKKKFGSLRRMFGLSSGHGHDE